MGERIISHRDLQVYRKAFDAMMQIFEFSKKFPEEETYSLTDQLRRASPRSARTWQEHGVNDATRMLLSQNCPIVSLKLPRLKSGLNLRSSANILTARMLLFFTSSMMKFSERSLA